MKALGVSLLLFSLLAGAASARSGPSLHALSLTPPVFRASGFTPHERVTVTVRGAAATPIHLMTSAQGRFRVRLAALPACRAWTVRAIGARGGAAAYRHARCASLTTDVRGLVQRGPTMPVCSDQTPCTAPAPGVTVQAFEAGNLVAETTTGSNGEFSFSLAGGDYTIQALARGTEPKTVHVDTSNSVHVDLFIDTGIR